MNAYKLAGHQHVCEIERELGLLAGHEVRVTFTAQVVPVCRGIMSHALRHADAAHDATRMSWRCTGRSTRADASSGSSTARRPSARSHVRGTNYCNLVVNVDERTDRLRVVSYIDNLVKGQAGSALQNMNLLFGLPETMGLDRPGLYP